MTRLDWQKLKKTEIKDKSYSRLTQDAFVAALTYRMPFGIHKGKEMVTIPTKYLQFIARTSPNMNIVERCSNELSRRGVGR